MSMGARPLQPLKPENEILYEAFKASPIGIALENMEGQPLLVNPALCKMLGFTEEEMLRKHCVDFSPQEDANKDWALFEQLRAGTIDHYQIEKRYFRRDGSLMWGRLNISLSNRNSPMVVAMVEDITEQRAAEELRSSMSRRLLEAQEHERASIARDLHDDVCQRLALLAMELEQIEQNATGSDSELHRRLLELRNRTMEISIRVQTMSHELHSSKLEYLGLLGATRSWCREFADLHKMEIRVKSRNVTSSPAPDVSLCLFRILQEAVQNASKHSGVNRVEVELGEKLGEIYLTVRDSGSGFEPRNAIQQGGLGLISMRERVRLVNGTIVIESKPKGGTTIQVCVPIIALGDSQVGTG